MCTLRKGDSKFSDKGITDNKGCANFLCMPTCLGIQYRLRRFVTLRTETVLPKALKSRHLSIMLDMSPVRLESYGCSHYDSGVVGEFCQPSEQLRPHFGMDAKIAATEPGWWLCGGGRTQSRSNSGLNKIPTAQRVVEHP